MSVQHADQGVENPLAEAAHFAEFPSLKRARLSQLNEEIQARCGYDVALAGKITDPDQPVSKKNLYWVYVSSDEGFDPKAIQAVIDQHEPLEDAPARFSPEVQSLVDRLLSGEDLDAAGLSTVVRSLIGD